nr:hypothetical protein CFP56_47901 [Quercus suber]
MQGKVKWEAKRHKEDEDASPAAPPVQQDASPAATPVQHSMPLSAAASASGEAATPVQHSMPLSAAASALSSPYSPAATPVQHSMPPNAAASASGDADLAATISAAQISAAQIGTQCTTKTRTSRPNSSRSPDYFSELKNMKTFHLEVEYEKQEDAPAATPVQHSMPPNAAASASGDADPVATISAAQISAT